MTTITIRNVREETATELRRRARKSGRSFQAFLHELLESTAAHRPIEEILEEIEADLERNPPRPIGADEIVRTLREMRDDAGR
jgi:plasmid stability protein